MVAPAGVTVHGVFPLSIFPSRLKKSGCNSDCGDRFCELEIRGVQEQSLAEPHEELF